MYYPSTDKILSYTNKSVDSHNTKVRFSLYGEDSKNQFVQNEQLICNDYFKLSPNKIYYTSDCIKVRNMSINSVCISYTKYIFLNKCDSVYIGTKEEKYEYKCYILECADEDGHRIKINHIHEDDTEKCRDFFVNLKKDLLKYIDYHQNTYNNVYGLDCKKLCKLTDDDINELWNEYYIKRQSLLPPIVYNYCTTIYKSQGSTYETIYVDLINIINVFRDKDDQSVMFKAIYTAITRASKIYICCAINVNKQI
jgi:hypothetical protein